MGAQPDMARSALSSFVSGRSAETTSTYLHDEAVSMVVIPARICLRHQCPVSLQCRTCMLGASARSQIVEAAPGIPAKAASLGGSIVSLGTSCVNGSALPPAEAVMVRFRCLFPGALCPNSTRHGRLRPNVAEILDDLTAAQLKGKNIIRSIWSTAADHADGCDGCVCMASESTLLCTEILLKLLMCKYAISARSDASPAQQHTIALNEPPLLPAPPQTQTVVMLSSEPTVCVCVFHGAAAVDVNETVRLHVAHTSMSP